MAHARVWQLQNTVYFQEKPGLTRNSGMTFWVEERCPGRLAWQQRSGWARTVDRVKGIYVEVDPGKLQVDQLWNTCPGEWWGRRKDEAFRVGTLPAAQLDELVCLLTSRGRRGSGWRLFKKRNKGLFAGFWENAVLIYHPITSGSRCVCGGGGAPWCVMLLRMRPEHHELWSLL